MPQHRTLAARGVLVLTLALVGGLVDDAPARGSTPVAGAGAQASTGSARARPQPRPHGSRLSVDPARVTVDDGDTVSIRWSRHDTEIVRILGIDTPETRHLEHDIPYDQPFGPEARAFAEGAFAAAGRVELLRAPTLDPYGRTLGYVFLDGANYSVAVVEARLALETVSHYGDNGLPREAAAVRAAAEKAGPVPFEPPYQYRRRMRELSRYLKAQGTYPEE
jgi:micrococcal nuclease